MRARTARLRILSSRIESLESRLVLTGDLGICESPPAETLVPLAAEGAIVRDLVLVTHGWRGSAEGWPRTMQAAMAESIEQTNASQALQVTLLQWDDLVPPQNAEVEDDIERVIEVVALDWSRSANTFLPNSASTNAAAIGERYVDFLVESNYSRVHLIAHSAGSWMIDAMVEGIEANQPEALTQVTFLDAFTPDGQEDEFGEAADWAEHVVDDGVLFSTNEYFQFAINIDVTRFGPDTGDDGLSFGAAGHAWPHEYYLETATTPQRSVWGFGQSLAMGAPLPDEARGTVIVIGRAGDSNDDGRFDTTDLIVVFKAGKFETGVAANHYEGDWNGDGVFNSSDLVAAFATGNYLS